MEESGKTNGETELCFPEDDQQTQNHPQDSFVWDETSQLYYHPRSGFYHDPNAGWYYSTNDGLYYKFEDGNYILLDSSKEFQSTIDRQSDYALDESREHAKSGLEVDQDKQNNGCESEQTGCTGSRLEDEVPGNPPPTSEWLEDTLIELYLSGYATAASDGAEPSLPHEHDDDTTGSMLSADANNEVYVQQDGELSSDHDAATTSNATVFSEEISWEEESWLAQYGQVVQQEDELRPECPVVDIWDWSIDRDITKEGNCPGARLLGTLVKPSSSLHPSISSHGRRLRTAPICRVHLDLVQVRSGQVYKLRSPSVGYLATLSSYDASNPTKEWSFPVLSNEVTKKSCESKAPRHVYSKQNESSCLDRPSISKKHKPDAYRDRAAERRAFHKEFDLDLGDKNSADETGSPSYRGSESVEWAAAEALEMSLGAGSYAQKILKTMGWKEGEGLGKTQQGLTEPLQGTGNKGTAGLGWPSGWRT